MTVLRKGAAPAALPKPYPNTDDKRAAAARAAAEALFRSKSVNEGRARFRTRSSIARVECGAEATMKIAQVSPLMEAVPPKLYGGTERIVAYLTNELVELGHDVTLFASGDSQTKAKLAPGWPSALRPR